MPNSNPRRHAKYPSDAQLYPAFSRKNHPLDSAKTLLIFIGLIISLTIVGAFIGIPLMIIGVILVGFGLMRRRTVITNVVQVTNVPAPAAGQSHSQGVAFTDEGAVLPPARREPPLLNESARRGSSSRA